MPDPLPGSIVWPFAGLLILSLGLEQLLVPRPSLPWQRPVRVLMLHAGLCALFFAPLLLLVQRPWFCSVSLVALQILVIMISNAKYHSLHEPFIYQDFSYFIDALRFPRLYLPFLGVGRALVAITAFCTASYAGLVLEAPLSSVYSLRQIGGATLIVIGIGVLLVLLACSAGLRLTLDPVADLQHLGLLASLWGYYRAERQPWQGQGASCFEQLPVVQHRQQPNLVVIQSESFFDPRRWLDGISPELLRNFDRLRHEAIAHGPLAVPAWGANTVRTEYAFLSGIANQDLGIHRFKPYRTVARQGLPTLASVLKQQGYRTVCLHPYALGFYERDQVLPLLGFDEFIDLSRFCAVDYHGQYVGDAAVAREICAELTRHDPADARPLFLLAITMENHGPLHLEQDNTAVARKLYENQNLALHHDLNVYLRHLENADTAIGMVTDKLESMQRNALLCIYGDHIPIMPDVYKELGEPDGMVDYLVWCNKQQRHDGARQPRRVEQLAAELLRAMGLYG